MREEMAVLDQYVAPGLRLWMLIGLVSAVLLVMIVIVCCFVRLRIPRTKRQIELRAAKRRKRKAERTGAEVGDQHEQDPYRGGQTIVLNSFNNAGGINRPNGGRRGGGDMVGQSSMQSKKFTKMLRIWDLPATEEDAIEFFQDRGLLHANRECQNGHKMKLYLGKRNRWCCNTRGCRQELGLRSGNWFSNTKLPYVKIVRFIYCWAEELTSVKWCDKQINIDHSTCVDWNNYMREVCIAVLTSQEKKYIGGEGQTVEIDESLFTKRKNNAGRILPQQWVFGGICRQTKQCFLVEVPDRTAATLIAAIEDNIAPGTTIFSDSWKGYKTSEIEEAGFEHFKVNHRYNFVDPESGTHTQTVERMWGSAKWRNKKHRGTARHHLESYFAEFMWRKMIDNGDVFEEVMRAWAKYWPLE